MKRFFLFIVTVFLFAYAALADSVEPERAMQIAKKFVPQSSSAKKAPGKGETTAIVYTHKMPKSNRAAFYIVNVGDGSFVLVSADDVAHQILGYSFSKNWPVAADGTVQLPPHVKSFFDDLAAQMEAAIEKEPNRAADDDWIQSKAKAPRRAPSNMPESVEPLLTTTWDQGQYYNAFCPADANGPDGHVLTGCVATAMAQIINYWGSPVHGRGTHSYDTTYGTLSVNYAESNYDFNNMPDELTVGSTETQVNAVAKLMYDCGIAANMEYGAAESGAYSQDARAALINFFRFSPDLSFAEKAYFSNNEWNNLMRENIVANQPVIYSGFGTGGHTFVLDGYKEDDYFHFNFGWSGFADGWYLTSSVNPGSSDYNSSQSALVGIVPDENGNVILGQTEGTSSFFVDEPLEFYHLMGHNTYDGSNYNNPCNNTVTFISANNENPLVADIIEFEDQRVDIYDGANTSVQIRSLIGGNENDLTPVVSTQNRITLTYNGNMYDAGFKLVLSQNSDCRMVSNIVTAVESTTVHLTWTENGTATQWQVEYGEKGFSHGEGTLVTVDNNTLTIENLQKFTEYDFYIRSVGANNQYGPWNLVSVMIEAPYWTDIVTSQPDGYQIDEAGNVTISSAEGLAWFASVANGLNGMPHDEVQWSGKTVRLVNDINLSEFRWQPIKYGFVGGVFDGQGHTIKGLYVKEDNDAGLFSNLYGMGTKVIDIKLDDINIYSSSRAGGFAASIDFCTLFNCSVNGSIYGRFLAGGIAAFAADCEILNSFTNCNIIGNLRTSGFQGTGGIVGVLRGVNKHVQLATIKNCYSTSSIRAPIAKGGLVGYAEDSYIYNCYSLAQNNYEQIGSQTLSTIIDNKTFSQVGNDWLLTDSVVFDGEKMINLIEALNWGTNDINIHGIRKWIANSFNNNLPAFGDTIDIICENVSNVSARNIVVNGNQAVEVSWTENGTSSEWEIRYGIQTHAYEEICDTFCYFRTSVNPDTIYGLNKYNGEKCIINVRPYNNHNQHGAWSKNCILTIDTPYWTDAVTSQPEGYQIDIDGNVKISTAEGLAWLISVVNGYNSQIPDNMHGKQVVLDCDVDMSAFRWTPIGVYGGFVDTGVVGSFEGIFDGGGHIISGFRIDENSEYVGMFAILNNSSILNLTLDNCSVSGTSYVGALCGFAERSHFLNCNINANVQGISDVGGILGALRISSSLDHCCYNGEISAIRLSGGIVGSINNNLGASNGIISEVLIKNCCTTGSIIVQEQMAGGLIGLDMHYCKLQNSFSNCKIVSNGESGGLVGYCYGSEFGFSPIIDNCYYTFPNGNYNITGSLVGFIEYRTKINNCYAERSVLPLIGLSSSLTETRDIIDFSYNDSIALLHNPIYLNNTSSSDLLDALNSWVLSSNDSTYYLWHYLKNDTIPYPVFSSQLTGACQAPHIVVDSLSDNCVRLKWNSIKSVQSYEIEYGHWCFNQGTGITTIISDTTLTITNLSVGEKYDIYIRSKSEELYSKWEKVTIKPDKLYWKDVVTSQPEGWEEDANGNIYISKPEALAWMITYSEQELWNPHTVHIMNDLDIGKYKWTTFGKYWLGWNFEGHGHTISGLYIDEDKNEIAFLHTLYNGYIRDLFFDNCFVRGNAYVATICHNNGGKIINCGTRGKVLGNESVGGLISINSYDSQIINSFSSCEIVISSFGSSLGGFCAINYGDFKNCYSSSTITIDSAYYARCQRMGIFTGEDYSNYATENIAYWLKDDNSFITPGCSNINEGYHSFNKNRVLQSPISIDDINYTDLVDALNAWVDVNNSECQYRHWVEDTENVNGGFPVFAPRYTLTYIVDGEVYQTRMYEAGATLIPEAEPTKDGYVFGGWNNLPETMPDHDVEVTAQFYLYGDVNTDSEVDLLDVVDIARFVVGTPAETFMVKLADLNHDKTVNVTDAVVLVNEIAGDQNFVKAWSAPSSVSYDYDQCELQLLSTGQNALSLCLNGEADFTAFQFTMDLPEEMNISDLHLNDVRKDGHQLLYNRMEDGSYRVVVLSLTNNMFNGSEGELLNIGLNGQVPNDISIHDIYFVTINGTEVAFEDIRFSDITTQIKDLTSKNDTNNTLFDLQGRRRHSLQRGVNIINGKKIIIK